MSDLDPRYIPYGSLALLTLESAIGAPRMRNPAIIAIALANATAVQSEAVPTTATPSWRQ